MKRDEEFELVNNAFDLFTLAERRRALEVFAELRYATLDERFFEAVHRVITEKKLDPPGSASPEEP